MKNVKKLYVVPQDSIEQLEEICLQLQHLFLNIFSNFEFEMPEKDTDSRKTFH